MKINRLIKALWVLWVGSTQLLQYAHAQHTYIRTGGLSDHILDRLEIKSGSLANDYFHSTLKSYRRKAIANYIDSFPINTTELSDRDYLNMAYLINDNFEWSSQKSSNSKRAIGKEFYRKKAALFSAQIPDFNLVVNPVLYYQVSSDNGNSSKQALINNRGVEIRGNIGGNIGFYTQVSDEILRPYSWIEPTIFANGYNIPYANFYKTNPNQGTYSYFATNAYITANINKYMDMQFGHTNHFIGDGYRSLILGNMHPEYLNLRLNTRIWRMNYTNIWGELRQRAFQRDMQPRHFFATHHLSLNLGKNFNIGLFETTVYNRDSTGVDSRIELNYLNPVVFYKSIENGMNSVDKSMLGLNFKYNFLRKFSLYGQFILTEFVFNELMARNGWEGNKYGVQLGLKAIDVVGIKNLDLQTEFNLARPFLYASYNTYQTFSNFNQNLAHPYGANFYELIGIVRYQTLKRLYITGKFIFATYGNDTNGSNWGKDPKKDYETNSGGKYGNFIGQGVATDFMTGELIGSYMLRHNLFLEARAGMRKITSVLSTFNMDLSYFTLGIRLNINDRQYDF